MFFYVEDRYKQRGVRNSYDQLVMDLFESLEARSIEFEELLSNRYFQSVFLHMYYCNTQQDWKYSASRVRFLDKAGCIQIGCPFFLYRIWLHVWQKV